MCFDKIVAENDSNNGNSSATIRTGTIGYWLGKPYWGHGYCTEVARELVRYWGIKFGRDRSKALFTKCCFRKCHDQDRSEARSAFAQEYQQVVVHHGRRWEVVSCHIQKGVFRKSTIVTWFGWVGGNALVPYDKWNHLHLGSNKHPIIFGGDTIKCATFTQTRQRGSIRQGVLQEVERLRYHFISKT